MGGADRQWWCHCAPRPAGPGGAGWCHEEISLPCAETREEDCCTAMRHSTNTAREEDFTHRLNVNVVRTEWLLHAEFHIWSDRKSLYVLTHTIWSDRGEFWFDTPHMVRGRTSSCMPNIPDIDAKLVWLLWMNKVHPWNLHSVTQTAGKGLFSIRPQRCQRYWNSHITHPQCERRHSLERWLLASMFLSLSICNNTALDHDQAPLLQLARGGSRD